MACEYGGRNQRLKVDRISSLPNELLSLILSFLPTKCAIGTSILSNRWRYLWTSVTSLDFDASPEEESNSEDFTDFVDKVFRKCDSSHIQRFRLHFRSLMADYSDITTWINQATKLMVSEMDINVYKLPSSIFGCRTLTVLKLAAKGYRDDINIPSFYLPCLKVLHIEWKNVWNWPPKALMEKIFGSCPVLEDLTLTGSLGCDNEDEFVVSAPTLKTLRLHLQPCLFRSPSGISSRLAKFRNLTCVEVVTWDHRFWASIPELMKGSPSLEVLSLEQKGPIDKGKRAWHENVWVKPKSVPNCLGFHLAVIKIKGFKGRKQDLELLKYCLGNGKVLRRLTINRRGLPLVQELWFREELLKFSKASECCQIQFHGNDYPYKSM